MADDQAGDEGPSPEAEVEPELTWRERGVERRRLREVRRERRRQHRRDKKDNKNQKKDNKKGKKGK